MGKRHERHAFLPGKFVFPGGRVDAGDTRIAVTDALDPAVERRLLKDMKGRPSTRRARAMALAAIRETYEETGLLIGAHAPGAFASRSRAWQPFAEHGVSPVLAPVGFFCRAVTPPRRPRRYDTRFFCVSADHIAKRTEPADCELLDLHWLTFDKALNLDLPIITRVVLEELREKLQQNRFPALDDPVPYYYMRNGVFRRKML
jgi:8-oxo-dGTP pyrophosphatase MutT (NUDIX family)